MPVPALSNPLLEPSPLPLQAPVFDKIVTTDYEPAFEEAIRLKLAEIAAITANPEPPNFENTVVALEKAGQTLQRVEAVFYTVFAAQADSALEAIDQNVSQKLADTNNSIYLNDKLFGRLREVYEKRASLGLDSEAGRLLDIYYLEFVRSGAELSPAHKVEFQQANIQLADLESRFSAALRGASKTNALIVDDRKALEGLSSSEIDIAAEQAASQGQLGKFLIPLQNTTQQPALAALTDRSTREKFFANSVKRAERGDTNDTREIIAQIAALRAKKTKLLGFANFSSYALADQMAKTPDNVRKFISDLVPPASTKAREEASEIQAEIDQIDQKFTLEPWDWQFYSAKVKDKRYAVNDARLKEYLEFESVLQNGLFYAATKLYGVSFKERKDLPVYDPGVRAFEVFDEDGTVLGLVYLDCFIREGKQGGAWSGNLVKGSKLLARRPVVFSMANFPSPASGRKALLSFTDVTTLFHEFGHALHLLFAENAYPSLSSIDTARDWVEFPSQFNEHWALEPEILKNYAVHFKTAEPIPTDLIDTLRKSQSWDKGYWLAEYLAASALDQQWHSVSAGSAAEDPNQFEIKALKDTHTDFKNVPPRYHSSYFAHIWSNGYAANYYAYPWTALLADDAYSWFSEHGGLTRANGDRFRRMILAKARSGDYDVLFRQFYGKDPDAGPMFERLGLNKP
ncbi:M3 family metallopeptidase [Rhizobium leguminosarum]